MRIADTSDEARQLQIAVYRSMSPERRVETALAMSEQIRVVALAGIARRQPRLKADALAAAFVRMLHGDLAVQRRQDRARSVLGTAL